MYEFTAELTISGNLADIWAVATDVDRWPDWDPHELAARLDGAFEPGGTGWSKPRGGPATTWEITEVQAPHRWSSRCALPGGALTGDHRYTEVAPGRVRCVKVVRVTGPLTALFRLHFARVIRRDALRTFAALERTALERAARAAA